MRTLLGPFTFKREQGLRPTPSRGQLHIPPIAPAFKTINLVAAIPATSTMS